MTKRNEAKFTQLVNEYNRRVESGYSKDYCQRAWKVVITVYRENQYEPWMRKFTVREADKIIYKVGCGRPNYTKQYIDWKVKEVTSSACYLLHVYYVESGELYASKIGTAENPQKRFQEEVKEYEALAGAKVRLEVRMCEACHNLAATIACESRMRAHFINKYEEAFQLNDRFVGVLIDPREARRIAKAY
jgi:hypothetical protein